MLPNIGNFKEITMISHITLGKSGLPQYLETGSKKESDLARDDKDTRIAILGSIDALKDSIEWLNKNKNWKNSYYHATLSFSFEEWDRIKDDPAKLDEIVKRYLELNFPWHELGEICFHAEAHVPKILWEKFHSRGNELDEVYEEGEMVERLPHIHIGVSMQNLRFAIQVSSVASVYIGRTSKGKTAEIFKQTCDEIINHEFGFSNAVVSRKGKSVKGNSCEANMATWQKFVEASRKKSKGRENMKDTIEEIEVSKPKIFKGEVEAIKMEAKEFWATYQKKAKSVAKNLLKVYNPDEMDKKIDAKYIAALKELDASVMIDHIREQFGIPKDKIRKHESENKIEINQGAKWKKLSLTDFFIKFMGLNTDETVRRLEYTLS